MSYGFRFGAVDFTYGTFSVIAKGTVVSGTTTISRSSHPDITDWRVVFTPIGIRDPGEEEIRPSFSVSASAVSIVGTSDTSPHLYLVLGR
jgi:hypothetical protein